MASSVRPKRSGYTSGFVTMDSDSATRKLSRLSTTSAEKLCRTPRLKFLRTLHFTSRTSSKTTRSRCSTAQTRSPALPGSSTKPSPPTVRRCPRRSKRGRSKPSTCNGSSLAELVTRGDAGSGPYDLFAYSAKLTQFGGVDRKYIKKLSRQVKDEKAARKALAARRKATSGNAEMTPKERRKLKWVVASKNKPGIFFGVALRVGFHAELSRFFHREVSHL